ncbi:MAG TPA: hypothetical protein VED37_17295, partial [Ktedonobacteraceae bacterium]|nr:hypothetical protein [Ktedonobacteraceae bacterium]
MRLRKDYLNSMLIHLIHFRLEPPGTLVEQDDETFSPITPIPDPITPIPEVEDVEETERSSHDVDRSSRDVAGRPQGSPLHYTITPIIQTYAPHSTLLVDRLRKKRLRTIAIRRYSRNQLRAARVRQRRVLHKFWISIACTTLVL